MAYDPTATDDTPSFPSHLHVTVQKSFWSTPMIETGGKSDFESSQQTRLYWVLSVDDCVQSNYEGKVPEKTFINWTVGKGWEADPSGFVVSHEDDNKDKFRGDSKLGHFLSMIAGRDKYYSTDRGDTPVKAWDDDGPVEYDLIGAGQYLKKYCADNNTTILDARCWIGTRWETRGLIFNYGGDIGRHEKTMPVAFLGGDGEVVDVDSSGSGSVNVEPEEVAKTLPPETPSHVVEDLAKLLSTASSRPEFMKNAIRMEEVKGDIKDAVMNEETGPWSVR